MKIVITGGCGFVGLNLMAHLAATEPFNEVVLLDVATPTAPLAANARYVFGDIRNFECLMKVFEGAEEVYNLAGVLGTEELFEVASLAVDVNVKGAVNVFAAARAAGVKRVYNVEKTKFQTDHENPYTMTKMAASSAARMYKESFGMSIAMMAWPNVIGAHQHLYPIKKLFPLAALCALEDVGIPVYGSGNQLMDPLDVKDLCVATVYACRNLGKYQGDLYFGSGTEISVNEYLDAQDRVLTGLVASPTTVVPKAKRDYLPMRPGEVEVIEKGMYTVSPEFARAGIAANCTLEDSIKDVIHYVYRLPNYHKQNALQFFGLR